MLTESLTNSFIRRLEGDEIVTDINAIPFYEKNGFLPLNSDDEDSDYTRLLYFDLNDID